MSYYEEEDEDNNFMQVFTSNANESQSNQKIGIDNLWFFDTEAMHHLTNNKNLLDNYCPLPQALQVTFDDHGTKALAKGKYISL